VRPEDTAALANGHIERGPRGALSFGTKVVSVPGNDESDCRVRAANDTERREVPHVIHVLRDGE